MRTLEFTPRFLRLEFWLRLIVEALTPVFICVNSAHVPYMYVCKGWRNGLGTALDLAQAPVMTVEKEHHH